MAALIAHNQELQNAIRQIAQRYNTTAPDVARCPGTFSKRV
jgi:hypothetical protein